MNANEEGNLQFTMYDVQLGSAAHGFASTGGRCTAYVGIAGVKLIRSVEEIGRYKNLEVVSQTDLDD